MLKLGQSDVADSSAVHVTDLDTLLPGDVIYNGIHLWMYQSDHAQRMDWIETVNEVEKLGVKTIIAGHTDPSAPDNDAARLIETSRQYIYDFDEAVASSSGGEEVVSKMTAVQISQLYTPWLAAYTQPCRDPESSPTLTDGGRMPSTSQLASRGGGSGARLPAGDRADPPLRSTPLPLSRPRAPRHPLSAHSDPPLVAASSA